MSTYEDYLKLVADAGITSILGIDEVGRGALAGEMTLASCFMPVGVTIEGLRDSKKLSDKAREAIVPVIKDNFYHQISSIQAADIDAIGLTRATTEAVSHLISHYDESLAIIGPTTRTLIVMDGDAIPHIPTKNHVMFVTKADDCIPAVMAAANIAKAYRDNLMMNVMHHLYPHYKWDENVGYGTAAHLAALKEYGACLLHRKSFRPVTDQLMKSK